MKLLEHITLGIAAIICAGVLEMAIAAADVALDAWREGIENNQGAEEDIQGEDI